MISYKFDIGEYLAQTLHLADAEDLAYRRLLDLYYLSERPIPLDVDAVARKVGLDLDVVEPVLAEFFEKTEDGYRHAQCDLAISRHQKRVKVNRESGKRGGRPPKSC